MVGGLINNPLTGNEETHMTHFVEILTFCLVSVTLLSNFLINLLILCQRFNQTFMADSYHLVAHKNFELKVENGKRI